jgi:2-haloacid dehalogenase
MVAAHLNDLRGAKDNGMQTIYVESPGEEEWESEQIERARREGWVDLWVDSDDEGPGGFITVAEKLGIELSSSDQTRRFDVSAPANRFWS